MKPDKRLKIIIPSIVLLSGLAVAWGIIAYQPPMEQQTAPNAPPLVTIIRVEPQTLSLNIDTQGIVMPRTEIDLVPEVAGKIIYRHPDFFAGGFFALNELLLTIDPRDYDYAVAEAEARIAEARRLLISEEAQADQARSEWQALGNGKPSALAMREPQLAEARAKLKAAEADLAKARLKRSRCELRAPFAGRLRNASVGLGQYVQAGEKLARIYSSDAAEIRLPLSTDQLGFVDLPLGISDGNAAKNTRVTLTADFAGTPQSWTGRIVRTEGAVDETNGQIYVVAEVLDPYSPKAQQTPLLVGLFVKASVQGKTLHQLYTLPPNALNAAQEVLLVDDDLRLHIKKLDIIRNEPDRILIKNGLNAGDKVILSGIQVPVENMQVRIDDDMTPTTAGGQTP